MKPEPERRRLVAANDPAPVEPAPAMRRRLRRQEQDLVHRPLVGQLRARAASGVIYWHTPNGEVRSALSAKILKGLGVRAGMPDIMLYCGGQLYAIECKCVGGRLTDSQKEMLAALESQGAEVVVVDTLNAGVAWLETRGLLKGRMQ